MSKYQMTKQPTVAFSSSKQLRKNPKIKSYKVLKNLKKLVILPVLFLAYQTGALHILESFAIRDTPQRSASGPYD